MRVKGKGRQEAAHSRALSCMREVLSHTLDFTKLEASIDSKERAASSVFGTGLMST